MDLNMFIEAHSINIYPAFFLEGDLSHDNVA